MEKVQATIADGNRKVYAQIMALAMTDADFRAALKANPASVLAKVGLGLDASTKIRIVENSSDKLHIVIPPRPTGELDDDHLQNVAGGASASTSGSASTAGCPVSTAGTVGSSGCAGG